MINAYTARNNAKEANLETLRERREDAFKLISEKVFAAIKIGSYAALYDGYFDNVV